MLQPVPARCSQTCCCLFKHVAARHVAAFSIMLQLEMLPTFQACCSRTCCLLFAHVLAGHVAAFSSMLQLDMLPPVRTCCSLIHTCCSRDRIFSMQPLSADQPMCSSSSYWPETSRCSTGLFIVDTSRCSLGPWNVEKSRSSCLGTFRCSSIPCRV